MPSQLNKILFRIGVLTALLVPLVVFLYYWLTLPPPPPPPEPPVTPAGPSREDILTELRRTLAGFECARLTPELVPAASGTGFSVRLEGYVQQNEDIARLERSIGAIPGVTDASAVAVRVEHWPFCEAIEILSPYREYEQGPGIAPYQHPGSYREGEHLILELRAPGSRAAYLYVDYYQLDGTVVHMLPNPAQSEHHLAAGERLVFGRPEPGKIPWLVRSPFGREMIAVMATSTPLFETPRPLGENARDYFADLRRLLPGSDVRAEYLFIETFAGRSQ